MQVQCLKSDAVGAFVQLAELKEDNSEFPPPRPREGNGKKISATDKGCDNLTINELMEILDITEIVKSAKATARNQTLDQQR